MQSNRINLKKIPYEQIVTPNMVTNIEAEINDMIDEDAYVDFLHISDQLAVKHKVRNYNNKRSNGFTILIKEENGKYAYQVAVCNTKDNFSKRHGRYFACLRAKQEGFIDVPPEAIAYTPFKHYDKLLAVTDYFIKNVHNYKPPKMVKLPDVANKVPLKDLTKTFVQTLEEIVLGTTGPGTKVRYFTNKRLGYVEASVVLDLENKSSKNQYEQFKDLIGHVELTAVGKENKWYDRYRALYQLLSLITDTNKVEV